MLLKQPAPEVGFTTLGGEVIELRSLRGRRSS